MTLPTNYTDGSYFRAQDINNTNQQINTNTSAISAIVAMLGDYVVESGTNNGWDYRKWHSGKMEAWKKTSITTTVNTASGDLFISAGQTETMPFNNNAVWVASRSLQGTVACTTNYISWLQHQSFGSTTFGWNITRASSASQAKEYIASFLLVGEWQ